MINASDFSFRRIKLFDLLKNNEAKIVIYGRETLKRISTVPYDFDQCSDLLYLTGYERPGGALTIEKKDGNIYSTLFLPHRNKTEELWKGFRTAFEDAKQLSGVEKVRPITELEDWIAKNSEYAACTFYSCPPQQRPHSGAFKRIAPYIDAVRWIKSKKERELIKKACEITKKAFAEIKPQAGEKEGVLAAYFKYLTAKYGGTGMAYPVVAASGTNALCLHYLENNTVMKEGDTIMMDAGCEFMHYASDFTRTFPIGKIAPVKQDLLDMVDDVKNELVMRVKRGQISNLAHMQQQAERMLQLGLRGFGVNTDIHGLRRMFPHGVSHWIGLDIHDCDSVAHTLPLTEGCVFSVEPGLYFQMDDPNSPSELKGLGCRFEDTVIIE